MASLRGNAVSCLLWALLLWSGDRGCQAQRAGGAAMLCARLRHGSPWVCLWERGSERVLEQRVSWGTHPESVPERVVGLALRFLLGLGTAGRVRACRVVVSVKALGPFQGKWTHWVQPEEVARASLLCTGEAGTFTGEEEAGAAGVPCLTAWLCLPV